MLLVGDRIFLLLHAAIKSQHTPHLRNIILQFLAEQVRNFLLLMIYKVVNYRPIPSTETC